MLTNSNLTTATHSLNVLGMSLSCVLHSCNPSESSPCLSHQYNRAASATQMLSIVIKTIICQVMQIHRSSALFRHSTVSLVSWHMGSVPGTRCNDALQSWNYLCLQGQVGDFNICFTLQYHVWVKLINKSVTCL